MRIVSKPKKMRNLRGMCVVCGVGVSAKLKETKVIVDPESPNGARYVHCPTCSNEYLWLK